MGLIPSFMDVGGIGPTNKREVARRLGPPANRGAHQSWPPAN